MVPLEKPMDIFGFWSVEERWESTVIAPYYPENEYNSSISIEVSVVITQIHAKFQTGQPASTMYAVLHKKPMDILGFRRVSGALSDGSRQWSPPIAPKTNITQKYLDKTRVFHWYFSSDNSNLCGISKGANQKPQFVWWCQNRTRNDYTQPGLSLARVSFVKGNKI